MFTRVRPCVTAGVAVLAAGVLAVAPVDAAPSVPSVESSVQLTAIPSPFELYPRVVTTALQNTAELAAAYFADPVPLMRVTVENQIAALADAVEALAAGDATAVLSALGDFVGHPVKSVFGALDHLEVVMSQPDAAAALFTIMISPVLGGFAAAGVAIADAVDAAVSLDPIGLVNAVANIPGRVIDGVLNGGYGSPFGNFDNLPGLLTPFVTEGYLAPGPIAIAIDVDQDAAAAVDESTDEEAVDRVTSAHASGVAAHDIPEGPPTEVATAELAPPADEDPAETTPAPTEPVDEPADADAADDDQAEGAVAGHDAADGEEAGSDEPTSDTDTAGSESE